MVHYVENYFVSMKKKRTNQNQEVDRNGKIVEPRLKYDRDVVLDLKYRVSLPEENNDKWCTGALALFVPHRSVSDLLIINGNALSLTQAFISYYGMKIEGPSAAGSACSLKYNELHRFYRNENDIFHKWFPAKHISPAQSKGHSEKEVDPKEEGMGMDAEDTPETMLDVDLDHCPATDLNAHTNLQKAKYRPWSANPTQTQALADSP